MGRLVLVGTPIGNLEDCSPRTLRALEEADVVACEDTRRTRKLLTHFGIKVRELVVYRDDNERRRAAELIERIASGATVALVSDAGMPGLSDPGYRLVRACVERNFDVTVVPGPTAVVSALSVSGLPPGRFVFEGFLPRKPGDRRKRLAALATEPRTIVLFESPHRLAATLSDLAAIFGDRPAAVARELTKLHEEIKRGSLTALSEWAEATPPKGEIALVIGGAIHEDRPKPSRAELADLARALMDNGVARKDALVQVAQEAGVARRDVFDALVNEAEPESEE